MGTIRLENLERRLETYEIPTTVDGGITRKRGVLAGTSMGDSGELAPQLRVERLVLPSTVTLTASGTPGCISVPLDEAVLNDVRIGNALKARPPRLRVLRDEEPTPADASAGEGG